ncbi:MAG: RtcB family protein [Treponemataceae bacterium]
MVFKNKVGNEVKIFAENVEMDALQQIKELANFEPYLNSKIRIMPDVHAGKGCTIGTTMTVDKYITPNLVGVDIGCGMLTCELDVERLDFETLDKTIYQYIPNGDKVHREKSDYDFSQLRCVGKPKIDLDRAYLSLGSLGGGNHFIEVGEDKSGKLYLVIHSGSRNLGHNVASYYQQLANKTNPCNFNFALSYLSGQDFDDYVNDVAVIQKFASDNRKKMMEIIIDKMNINVENSFETIHNYLDTDKMILRKGAIRAEKGELVLIPMNMRDGCIIGRGLGNEDWNFSAPHGAGRVMSRTQAKKMLSMEKFRKSMEGIYSTSVRKSTLDESPWAYKKMNSILPWLKDTVHIEQIIKPVYNFKA